MTDEILEAILATLKTAEALDPKAGNQLQSVKPKFKPASSCVGRVSITALGTHRNENGA